MHQKLKLYEQMLRGWQGRMNLVSKSTLETAWERHFEDSLQLLPLLQRTKTLYDLGSGAGFPGLVIGICRPEIKVHLIESISKKCSFLEAVAEACKADNVTVHNDRVENLKLEAPDVITARAVTALDGLLGYCAPFAKENPDLTMIFPKGRKAEEEITQARTAWDFDLEKVPSQTDPEGVILVIKNLRKS